MSYKDFGLDEVKKSTHPGMKGNSYCPWCMQLVEIGFSMCFSSWVICEKCSLTATNIENNDRWQLADSCFKCQDKDVIGLRTHEKSLALHLCKNCIDWSKQQFRKRDKIALETKRTETMTIQEILNKCTIEGFVVKLPDILLDFETEYKPVNKKLEQIGGKWSVKPVEGFVFDHDPTEQLAALRLIKSKEIKKKNKSQNKELTKGINEIIELLTTNTETENEEMNFFKQLSGLIGESELVLSIRQKDDKITMVILPKSTANDKALAQLKPMTLSGTPDQVDADFFKTITEPLKKVTGIISNVESFSKQADSKVKEKAVKTTEIKPKSVEKKQKAEEKTQKMKPVPKPINPVVQDDLFQMAPDEESEALSHD